MATIITKNSSTASSVPLNTQLVQGELAVNVTDKRLFTENASGTVVELGTNPSTLVTSNTFLAFGRGNTEDMRLTSTGLGIGTSSPGNKLHVQGSGDVARLTNGTNSAYFAIDSAGFTLFTGAGQTGNGLYAKASDNSVQLWTNSSAKVFLDSSGNLGLGVTPSAWGAGSQAMQNGGGAVFQYNNDRIFIGQNNYIDASFGDKYIANGYATRYRQYAGTHAWYTAPSGTAGNAISFTQAMTLDASGNLGVGTTTLSSITSSISTLSLGGTNATVSGGVAYQVNGTVKAYDYVESDVRKIQTVSGVPIAFITSATERARIDSSGNLLVGTTNSAVNVGVGAKIIPSGSFWAVGATGDYFSAYNSSASAFRFYVSTAGNISATNTTISAISDQRLKENIQDIDVGLDKIMALKPRKFDWKEGKGKDIKGDRGWIAQEFEQVFPDMIDTWKDPAPEGEEPYKSVRADLIPVLVKAIQELKAELDSVKAELASLKGAA